MTLRRLSAALNPLGWLIVLLVLAAWQLLVATSILDYRYLPAPTEIASALGGIVSRGELWTPLLHTLRITLLASVAALAIGVLLGTLSGLLRPVRVFTTSSVDVLRTVPVVALMPVVLLIFGPVSLSEAIVATWAGVWPVLLASQAGVQGVHARLHDVAASFGLSKLDKLRKITLPAALPSIIVGARLAVVNALVVAIVAELLINAEGLGWELARATQGLQPEQMWAWAAVTGILGYLLNVALLKMVSAWAPGGSASVENGALG